MSENYSDFKTFGEFLKFLARSAGYPSASRLAKALTNINATNKKIIKLENYDPEKRVHQSTTSRWLNNKSLPKGMDEEILLELLYGSDHIEFRPRSESFIKFYELYDATKASEEQDLNENIFEIYDIKTSGDLCDLLSKRGHSYSTTHNITDLINNPGQHSRLLRKFLIEIVLEGGGDKAHIEAAIIGSNIICTIENASLSQNNIKRLEQKVLEIKNRGLINKSTMMSSLAFALFKSGSPTALEHNLLNLIQNDDWGSHDYNMIFNYYGSHSNQYAAIVRHSRDKNRQGLMRAHNAHRLIRLIDLDSIHSEAKNEFIIPEIRRSAGILQKKGLTTEAKILLKKISNE